MVGKNQSYTQADWNTCLQTVFLKLGQYSLGSYTYSCNDLDQGFRSDYCLQHF